MSNPSLALISVLFNSRSVLPDFIDSLLSQTYENITLYLVDNASTDHSLELAVALLDGKKIKVVFHQMGRNAGFAEANNWAIQRAKEAAAEMILLANNDLVFDPATLEKLVSHMEKTSAPMVSPVINTYDTRQVWYGGGAFSNLKGISYHKNKLASGFFGPGSIASFAPMCFLLIRPAVFEQVGLIPQKYFVYYEDTEFMLACKRRRLFVSVCAEATILHKVSSLTGGGLSDFTIYQLHRNRVIFLKENYFLPISLFYLGVFLLTKVPYYVKLKPRSRKTFLRALSDGLSAR